MSRYADDATISGSIIVTGSVTFNDQRKQNISLTDYFNYL